MGWSLDYLYYPGTPGNRTGESPITWVWVNKTLCPHIGQHSSLQQGRAGSVEVTVKGKDWLL